MCREKAGGQDEMRMLRAMYAEGEERLRQAGIEEAGLDAWYLLEFVTGVDKAHYYMEPDRRMEQSVAQEYEKVVNLRAEHIPLQHITGVQEFMGLGFRVSGDVLIPRQDTEVLVEEALKNNQDLAESLAKIDSAAAKLGVGTSQLAPSVSGAGAATSQSNSTKIANYNSIADRSYVNYQGQLSASWELDFWGKYRNNYTMLSDVLLNTAVSHEALRLSVASQTAQSYFALLALDMQLATAKRTLRTREDAFGIYTSRYRQGDITELDWQRARAEVETARAQVRGSTVAVDSAEASLAVLLGRSPRDIMSAVMPRGGDISKLPAPPVLPAGLPSELLERRPDVRAAEYMIMAYNANIGVARAEFFPSISLTGMLGTLSASVVNLFSGPAGAWSYGVTGSMPLLDFGRTWYNVKDAEAQKEAAIAVYRKTVQNAFKDVRTSLTSQREADAIVREEFDKNGLTEKVWQFFAVVPDMRSTGVRDGKRAFDWPVILRAVNTVDAMTATVPELPWNVLETITQRILAEVPGVCRVLYDLSPKPVATIEWE